MQYHIEYKESSGRGRGVFALKDFKQGELIEECPVVVLSDKESAVCEKTILDDYLYAWRGDKDSVIALGYGSLYNHSTNPNAEYDPIFKKKTIVYKAIKPIRAGEEILVDYNWKPEDTSEIGWFRV